VPSAIVMDLTLDESDAETTLNEFATSNETLTNNRSHEMDVEVDS